MLTYEPTDEELIELFSAAGHRDYQTVKSYLAKGVDPNIKYKFNAMLHVGAGSGDYILCKYLLTFETINIDVISINYEVTPLFMAVRHEHVHIVELLTKHGANVNVKCRNGMTSLHEAVTLSNTAIIRILIKYGGNVNAIDIFSHTPLSIAAIDIYNIKITQILLEAGADPNLYRPCSIPLLYEAILNYADIKFMRILQILIEYGADPNQLDDFGRNAMHFAAMNGSYQLCHYLNSINCQNDIVDVTDRTPYIVAIEHGNRLFQQCLQKESRITIGMSNVEKTQ